MLLKIRFRLPFSSEAIRPVSGSFDRVSSVVRGGRTPLPDRRPRPPTRNGIGSETSPAKETARTEFARAFPLLRLRLQINAAGTAARLTRRTTHSPRATTSAPMHRGELFSFSAVLLRTIKAILTRRFLQIYESDGLSRPNVAIRPDCLVLTWHGEGAAMREPAPRRRPLDYVRLRPRSSST